MSEKTQNVRRLEAQRNELNAKVRLLREELQLLQEQGSHVGEVIKPMDKKKVLVKVHIQLFTSHYKNLMKVVLYLL